MEGLLRRLHAEAARRVGEAYAPKSRGPLNTALRALADFSEQCPGRVLFVEKGYDGGRSAGAWNEWTFILFAVWFQTCMHNIKIVEADSLLTRVCFHRECMCFFLCIRMSF